ncbi:MAG: PAS domain S-box protein [Desulfobacteraceae bacterium]|nr:PAS domain S-box protein [Desulfobacteraceae bacterium]
MSIKFQAITLTGLIILLLSAGFLYHGLRQQERLTQTLIKAEDQQLQSILHNIEHYTFVPYEERLRNLLKTTPKIVEAFGRRDRDTLYRLTLPRYESLIKENKYLHVMHFHLPDSVTFLRMHKSAKYGDNLKGIRPIVDLVHKEHTVQSGFEVGRHGLYYRVVEPVFWHNEYIGAVELGIRAEEIADAVRRSMDTPMFTYLKQTNWQKATGVEEGTFIRRGDYALSAEALTFYDFLAKDFLQGTKTQIFENKGRYYHAHPFPVFNDFQGQVIGGLVLLQDITAMILEQRMFLYQAVFFTFLVCLAAIVVLSFYFNKVLGSLLTEINTRKKAQVGLNESSKKLLLLLNSTAEGIFGLNLDGECTFVNAAFLSILGYDSEIDFVGRNIHETIHFKKADGSDFPLAECPMCQVGKDGIQVEIDDEVLWRKDGTSVPVVYRAYPIFDEFKQVVGVVITFIDISLRKKTEEEYKRLAVAVENTVDEIIVTDLDGVIQYVNPAFSQVTGYSKEEAVGHTPRILRSGRQDVPYYRDMWETISSGEVWSDRIFNKTKDGRIIEEECTISPIKDEKGYAVGYVAVRRDMTQQNELENQLRQAQKMEAIGALAGGIAHDFNNLLNGIMGFTAVSLLNLDDPCKLEKNLNPIQNASLRAANLVKKILAFSRQSAYKRDHIDLVSVVQETVELLGGTLPATIEIHQEVSEQCQPVFADSGMILQVIMNLCTNAFHSMQDNSGTLTISLAPVELLSGNQQELPAGNYNLLAVGDTGHGISPEHAEKIFDPYFTTKKQGEGTGLGLATVHGIISDLGGKITMESVMNKGTTFSLYLPVSPEVSSSDGNDAEVNGQLSAPVQLSGHILFVDDEEMNVMLGKEVLEEAGCRFTGMTDSVEALGLFTNSFEEFDLVITDQTMPNLTGLEMVEKMVKIRPDLPVIVITGYTDSATMEKLSNPAISALLNKPFDLDILLATVQRFLPDSSGQHHTILSEEQEKPGGWEEARVEKLEPIRVEDVKQHIATTYNLTRDKIELMLESAKASLVKEMAGAADVALSGDFEEIWQKAHALNGLLLNIGASGWAERAQYIEKAARNNQDEEYGLLFEELKAGVAAMLK